MEFKRYSNYRALFFLYGTLFLLVFLFVLFVGGRFDNDGKYILLILLASPFIFLLIFEIDARFGAFYDTVYCDENGVVIKTRKKTVKLSWDEVKYIRAVRTRGALSGWEINAVDGEKYEMFPPYKKELMDYVKNLQLTVEVRM
ncbi:MAG: hypothetical protein II639_00200 [Clostridia bacterium]|nr:hypothetical protein [Clostridia bacterium]